MPWKEVKPMDEKVLFIADYLRGAETITDLCQRYGISRKTGYKWIQRYRQQGMAGLAECSRRPHQSPLTTPYALRQAIMALRQRRRTPPGAKKIQALLAQRFPNASIPSKTTIYNVLNQAGLVSAKAPRRRVAPGAPAFAPVSAPNALWSADFKGQFKTRSGHWCYPLTVMDHHSRYLLGCQGMGGTRFADTQHTFTRLFKEYGLPGRIRTDNGVPFATTATAGLSRLAVWWIKLGIVPERIAPGQPQQNARHERMHRTLKQAATKPPSSTLKAQQRRFDRFRQQYNDARPHEALDQTTPASCYTPSTRAFPDTLPEPHYPDYYEIRKVGSSGVIYWRNKQVYISHLLHDEPVGLSEVADGLWDVYFGPLRMGHFNERDVKGCTVPYLTIKM